MDFNKLKLDGSASGSYEPTQIPKDKYARIVEGRNRFFLITVAAVVGFVAVTSFPQYMMHRSVQRMMHKYARGRVLDLSPKLYDETDVALYEASKTVRVEFLVEHKVIDDGYYKIDESLSEKEQEDRRNAMTLDFMTKNDHHWVGSPVTFATAVRSAELKQHYDCVVIRDELMNKKGPEARALFNSAAEFLKPDGNLLVMDFGTPKSQKLCRLARWFNEKTNSTMTLTHNYHNWIAEDLLYGVEEEDRTLFGFYYCLCLKPKASVADPTIK